MQVQNQEPIFIVSHWPDSTKRIDCAGVFTSGARFIDMTIAEVDFGIIIFLEVP